MSGLEIAGLVFLGCGVGVLIGCVGIGGVLLVPGLTYLFGLPIQAAIAAAMFSYVFSGVVGTVIYARRGSIRWHAVGWLILGAGPAAFLGAVAVTVTPGIWLELLIAALIVFAGTHALRHRDDPPPGTAPKLGPAPLISLGGLTGLGSAMTGTGGPLILVPATVALGFPALTAVGLSQAVQLPIALLATAGNVIYGTVDWQVGGGLAAALVIGSATGARLAHTVPRPLLRRFLACVLLGVGSLIVGRIGYGQFVAG